MPAGYSATPLALKIGIKVGHRIAFVRAPKDWTIPALPDDVQVVRRARPGADHRRFDVILAFVRDAATLQGDLDALAEAVTTDGALWLAWPRRAGGHESDVSDRLIRDAVLPLGLVDVKVAALSEDWSGLKVVWRRERRAALS